MQVAEFSWKEKHGKISTEKHSLPSVYIPSPARHTEKHDRRIANQRDRHAQLALVAARVGARRAVGKLGQRQSLQQCVDHQR
jgi:hypothetical protein